MTNPMLRKATTGQKFLPGEQARQKFWSFVAKTKSLSDCWPWTGRKARFGYGRMHCGKNKIDGFDAREWDCHVFSKSMDDGFYPKKKICCHTCDNPSCVNPRHLYWGTHKENTQDMMRRGRARIQGVQQARAKLSERQVLEIFFLSKSTSQPLSQVAKRYGVEASTAVKIATGKNWSHLTGKKYVRVGQDNDQKRYVKKNSRAGSSHPRARLDEIQVMDILEKFHRDRVQAQYLASEYGVSDGTINQIIYGKSWRRVFAQYAGPRRPRHSIGKTPVREEVAKGLDRA